MIDPLKSEEFNQLMMWAIAEMSSPADVEFVAEMISFIHTHFEPKDKSGRQAKEDAEIDRIEANVVAKLKRRQEGTGL